MARISDLNKYYYDYNISDKDYLIGSNGDTNGKTQNYSMLSLAQYFAQYFQNVNEIDPTIPQWVKNITQQDISLWNTPRTDENVSITEATNFAQIGQTQKDFNKKVSDYKASSDLKNQEQDDRILNIEGINYNWSPTNRTLTLYDSNGNQLSQVSLVSLDNEGTDLRYNASTLSLELYNADNELLDSIPVSSFIGSVGTQLQLNSNQLQLKDSQGNILSTVSFSVSNINGLQTVLDDKLNKGGYGGTAGDLNSQILSLLQSLQNEQTARVNADLLKQDKLSSYDESIIIENGGNIEGNISLFQEYFEQQECELNFIPIQIIGVYLNGIKQKSSSYTITLPKKITVVNFTSGDYIEIQYTKLKN